MSASVTTGSWLFAHLFQRFHWRSSSRYAVRCFEVARPAFWARDVSSQIIGVYYGHRELTLATVEKNCLWNWGLVSVATSSFWVGIDQATRTLFPT
jgi:hypothetical protein